MTWFLKDTPQSVPIPTTPDVPLTENWAGVSAATSNAWRNIDGAGLRRRELLGETEKLVTSTLDRLGRENAAAILKNNGIGNPGMSVEALSQFPEAQKVLLGEARRLSEMDPKAWSGVDLTMQGVEDRVTERRKAEDADEQAIIAMSPHPVAAQFIGGLAAGMADPKQAPLLLVNPGGSLLKYLGWQARLGAGSAAINIPAEQRVAAELDKPIPDPVESLAMGALSGVALGGIARGVPAAVRGVSKLSAYGRGLAYHTERTKPTPGDHLIDTAEAALQADKSPAEAVAQAMQAEPPLPPREPLFRPTQQAAETFPDGSAMVNTPEPTALAPDPITTSAIPPAPGEAPQTTGALAAMANDAIVKAEPKIKKPVDLSTFVVRSGGIWKGSDTGEIAALEYKRPGFLKNNQFARSSAGDNGGGHPVDTMREMAVEAGYLKPDATINDLFDALSAERRGSKTFAQSDLAQALGYEGQQADARLNPDAPPDAVPSDTGWEVNPDLYDFDDPYAGRENLERDLNEYLDTQFPDLKLTASERAEIIRHLSTRGGNAQDVVYRIAARDRTFVEAKGPANHADLEDPAYRDWIDSLVGQGDDTGGGSGPVRPVQDAGTEGNGAAAAGDAFDVESTPIGDQFRVPGTERAQVANRDADLLALRQKQSKLRRPDQARVEDDATGLFATPNLEMFDDMGSPQAKAYIEQAIADMQEAVGVKPKATIGDAFQAKISQNIKSFQESYAGGSADDMRENPGLTGLADYADWLHGLTKQQWADIGDMFTASYNPFKNPATIDEVARKADLESVLADAETARSGAAPPDQGFGVDIPPGLVTDEGTQMHTIQDVLDEFDEMDRMEKEFAACMTRGVADGA